MVNFDQFLRKYLMKRRISKTVTPRYCLSPGSRRARLNNLNIELGIEHKQVLKWGR
jgi:hypothetical protein